MSEQTQIVRQDSGLPVAPRGDSFDIGQPMQGQQQLPRNQQDILIQALSNPEQFINNLGLTDSQAKNLQALITGGGAAVFAKYLGDAFGEPIAGALGGLLGGYVSQKIVKRVKKKGFISRADIPRNDFEGFMGGL